MKGTIPKYFMSQTLACNTCTFFCDNDEDIYYCELDKSEFPQQCQEYLSKEEASLNHLESV